jgi:IS5 family transposase
VGTTANVTDVTQDVSGDADYTGVDKRPEHQNRQMIWSIAARSSS